MNRLTLSLTSDELREVYAGRSIGDKVKLEVSATIDELTSGEAVHTVDEVSPLDSPAPKTEAEHKDEDEERTEKNAGNPSLAEAVSQTMNRGSTKL